MGLFTLCNCYVSFSMDFLTLLLDSKSHLPIPEFSGYHCITLGVPINLGNSDGFFSTLELACFCIPVETTFITSSRGISKVSSFIFNLKLTEILIYLFRFQFIE